MRIEPIIINNIEFNVRIKIENRLSTRVSIRNNSINIYVPSFLQREEIFKEINNMKNWAKEKILQNSEKFKPKPIKKYFDGQELQVREDKYILKIEYLDKAGSSARIIENIIFLYISTNLDESKKSKHISTLISRCIAMKKLPEVIKRVEDLNAKYFNQDIKKISLKNNQHLWGSCSSKGNINLSTKILLAPQEVFDYLCIHELSHLIEQNHSERFWGLVEKAMPDYIEKEKWLKENGRNCGF